MPSIPLIGGPMDGEFWNRNNRSEIHFPLLLSTNILESSPPDQFLRIRTHTYRLSPCGRRYLHTSLVDQN